MLLLGVGMIACDPTFSITYDNQTDKPIEIYLYGKFDVSLKPRETRTVGTIEFDKALFEARTLDGRVIFSQTLTPDDLKKRGWRIAISEPASRQLSTVHGRADE